MIVASPRLDIARCFVCGPDDQQSFDPRIPNRLFHATQKSRLRSILKQGLRREHFGEIHSTMEIQPAEPTVYLSRHENSNNLNCRLLDEEKSDPILVLEIDSRCIDPGNIYPDDALFVGFAQEDVFETAEDVAEDLGIPLAEAEQKLLEWEDMDGPGLVAAMRPLWPWYLEAHGEISVAQDIPASSIRRVRDYDTQRVIFDRDSHDQALSVGPVI